MSGCPLCDPIWKTKHYETELGFVLCFDCGTCGIPMYVLKEHRPDFTDAEKDRIVEESRRMFAGDGATIWIRWVMRNHECRDHAHCHVEGAK